MSGKFEIDRSKSGKFFFNLKAANGEVILTSQMYEAEASARAGIESVRKNAAHHERFEHKRASDGEHYFNLTAAANGQVIGHSELYATAIAMESGIASVMKNAPHATLADHAH